jgi:hypothetical protein
MTGAHQRGKAPGRPGGTAHEAAQRWPWHRKGSRPAAMARPLSLWRTAGPRVLVPQEGT